MAVSAPTYLTTRNGWHSIRVRVPRQLAASLGRGELVRRLRTRDPRVARAVASRLGLRFGELWQMLRDRRHLTEAELKRLADEWLGREIDREARLLHSGAFGSAMVPDDADAHEAHRINADLFARDAMLTEERLLMVPPEARASEMDVQAGALLSEAGYGPLPGTRERAWLSTMLLGHMIELQKSKEAWAAGDPGHRPRALGEPVAAAAAAESKPPEAVIESSRSLKEAVDIFIAELEQNGATPKHVSDARSDFRVLMDALGEATPVAGVSPNDAGRVLEALRALPKRSRHQSALMALPFFERAEKARSLKLEPITTLTVKSYLQRWRKLFDLQVAAGHATSNPFEGRKAETVGRKAKKQNRTFTNEELETLFSSPLFQGAASESRAYSPGSCLVADWRFWAPLIALLSGARVAEIAQLRPTDVRLSAGHWVFDINDDAGKRLKNSGTARQIPVHPRLVDLGLLELAKRRLASGATTLLPDQPRPVGGDAGKQASKWMSEKPLPRLNLKTREGLGFHGFRHTLKSMLRTAGAPDTVSNAICGHDERSSGVGAQYGRVDLEAMARALGDIKLPDAIARIEPRLSAGVGPGSP